MPAWGGRTGVWPLSGEIWVLIPNQPIPSPYKDIWIQLTWAQQSPNVFPTVMETLFGVPASVVREIALPNGWYHTTYKIAPQPNPPLERILITGAVNVDEMVIDTTCTPEPSSMLALSSGLLGLAGLTIRRKR